MTSQRFCLRWNNHQTNLLSVFDQLLQEETFTDVTLAVEGQYLKAHKVMKDLLYKCICALIHIILYFQMVLSACSPYFQQIFTNHSEKDPIVILKDVPFADMKSLLDFMYRGEVSVDQERLTAFLRVAESLRIKGLTEVNDEKPPPPPQPPTSKPSTPPPPSQHHQHRLNPYQLQQQQQHQHQLQQRQSMESNQSKGSSPQGQAGLLLGSALTGQKRKRGRPRKLSGSDVGEDFDEFDREGLVLVMSTCSLV